MKGRSEEMRASFMICSIGSINGPTLGPHVLIDHASSIARVLPEIRNFHVSLRRLLRLLADLVRQRAQIGMVARHWLAVDYPGLDAHGVRERAGQLCVRCHSISPCL